MSEDRSTYSHLLVRVAVTITGFAAVIGVHTASSARSAAAPVLPAASQPPVTVQATATPAFELKTFGPEVAPAVPAFQLRPAEGEAVPALAGPALTVASWYGPGFNGRLTANGEVYDQEALTAAHPTLPFGTQVRVTNLTNGRQVVVRINDRGPYIAGRGIDLSHGAAVVLDMEDQGITQVALEVLGR